MSEALHEQERVGRRAASGVEPTGIILFGVVGCFEDAPESPDQDGTARESYRFKLEQGGGGMGGGGHRCREK